MSGIGVISWLVSDIKLLLLQVGVVGVVGLCLGPVAGAVLGKEAILGVVLVKRGVWDLLVLLVSDFFVWDPS